MRFPCSHLPSHSTVALHSVEKSENYQLNSKRMSRYRNSNGNSGRLPAPAVVMELCYIILINFFANIEQWTKIVTVTCRFGPIFGCGTVNSPLCLCLAVSSAQFPTDHGFIIFCENDSMIPHMRVSAIVSDSSDPSDTPTGRADDAALQAFM